jgi:SAM-dependent methyltransferase
MHATHGTEARRPAEVYEERFVPALFRPFSHIVAEQAGIAKGDRVLDVACGTGALACTAAGRAGAAGAVTGLDASPEMLSVARTQPCAVDWVEGRAEALPFADARFDAVVSQFGLMFFDDRVAALREMRRVLRPGGRLVVAVCDAVEHSPGYRALAALLQELFGAGAADAFRAPFAIGDPAVLRSLSERAGLAGADVVTRRAAVRFPSLEAMVATERDCVWTLGGLLDDEQFDRLLVQSRRRLQAFVQADGCLAFDMPSLLITARA